MRLVPLTQLPVGKGSLHFWSGLFVGLACFLAPCAALACQCWVERASTRDLVVAAFESADAVLEAEITSVESAVEEREPDSPRDIKLFTVQLLRGYKGLLQEVAVIRTGTGGADCGYEFELGQRYLIYAIRARSGDFETNICTRTQSLDEADADLRFLRGETPTQEDLMSFEERQRRDEEKQRASTGILCGTIYRVDGHPVGEARVLLWRNDNEPKQHYPGEYPVNFDGSYRIEFIEPGKYWLAAEAGSESSPQLHRSSIGSPSQFEVLEVEPGREQCGVNLLLYPQRVHTLRGNVLGHEGGVPRAAQIAVFLATYPGNPFPLRRRTIAQRDGSFQFPNLPEGEYRLSATAHGVEENQFSEFVRVRLTETLQEVSLIVRPGEK